MIRGDSCRLRIIHDCKWHAMHVPADHEKSFNCKKLTDSVFYVNDIAILFQLSPQSQSQSRSQK